MAEAKEKKKQGIINVVAIEKSAKQQQELLAQELKTKEYVEQLIKLAENETKDPVVRWRKLTEIYDYLLANVPLQEATFYLFKIENDLREIEDKFARTLTDIDVLIEVSKNKTSRFMDAWFMQVVSDKKLLQQYTLGLEDDENLDLYDSYAERVARDLQVLVTLKRKAKLYTGNAEVKKQLQQDINLLFNQRLLFLNATFYKPFMEGVQNLQITNFTKAGILLNNALGAMTRLDAQDAGISARVRSLIAIAQKEKLDAKSWVPGKVKFSDEPKVVIIGENESDQDEERLQQNKFC